MKILHIFKSHYGQSKGGVEKVIQELTTSLEKKGLKCTILCMDGIAPIKNKNTQYDGYSSKKIDSPGPDIISLPVSMRVDSLAFSWKMYRVFKRLISDHDVVHYHFPFPQQDIMHLLSRPSTPTILTYHSDIVRQKILYLFYRPLLNCFLSNIDQIVATSNNYLLSSPILKNFLYKVKVVPIGVDEESYPDNTNDAKNYWLSRLGQNFFLFVGVMRYYKGLNILLDAASRSKQHFVIAGTGPQESELRRKAYLMGVKNVSFLGKITEKDKVALLSLCRAVVFPSHLRSEAFGLTLVEGAMFGKPLISAEIGTGTSFINKDGVTGFVVPKGDPVALRQAVEKLAQNDSLSNALGRNSRKRYLELFTAQKQAECYLNLYHNLILKSNCDKNKS